MCQLLPFCSQYYTRIFLDVKGIFVNFLGRRRLFPRCKGPLVLEQDPRLAQQRIDPQALLVQILPAEVHAGDAAVFIGGVIIKSPV